MTKQVPLRRETLNEQAEGFPDTGDEPANPLETSVVPIIIGDFMDAPVAETGLTAIVNVQAEGLDPKDEQQDARPETEAVVTKAEAVTSPDRKADDETEVLVGEPRILIIEDSLELIEVIQVTLQSMDLESSYETHGARGLERLREAPPDLLLLDIGLPGMSGWKVLEELRNDKEENGGHMPAVIILTAHGDPANRLVGKLQGVDSYLVKPFTATEVAQIVKRVLGGSVA